MKINVHKRMFRFWGIAAALLALSLTTRYSATA